MSIIRAAGILFLAPENKVLFLKRGLGGDYPGYWAFAGGHHEANETALETAQREAREELGRYPAGTPELLARSKTQGGVAAAVPNDTGDLPGEAAPEDVVDFSTFIQGVQSEFTPKLNGEHVGYAWAPASQPPEPLHPGCRIALARLTMNELHIARAMAAGELTSPQRYRNVMLWAMRITGTGASIRSARIGKDGKEIRPAEYVWRRPELYLNDEFLARCNGLSVIWEHPEKATLDSKEFGDRSIGSIMLPYIKGDEVWGIAKVYDDDANKMMEGAQLSTSPTVVLGSREEPDIRLTAEDGKKILVEGEPPLLDHVAVCKLGVWDKGGPPTGVLNETIGDSAVANDLVKDAEEKARKDAEEKEKADRAQADADMRSDMKSMADGIKAMADALKAQNDSFTSRMDSLDKKCDSLAKGDDARKDGESEETYKERMDKKRKDAEEAEKAKKDSEEKAKKDAEEKEKADKEREDAAKADALRADEMETMRKEIADLHARTKPRTAEERRDFAAAQAVADSAYSVLGKQAPGPMDGEKLHDYRQRLANGVKQHSNAWKDVPLEAFADAITFAPVEAQIYADAKSFANRPDNGTGELTMFSRTTPSGHTINEFRGAPSSWMNGFAGNRQRAIGDWKQ